MNSFLLSWNNWTYHEKPHCFWVREYELLNDPERVPPLLWANRVWLMNENGMEEKNPLDWRRFEILVRDFAVNPFHRGIHEVAIGYFAPTSKESVFYYEEMWGGLWGTGATCQFDENAVTTGGRVLWRS